QRMPLDDVSHLVAENLGELRFVLQARQQADVDVDAAVRQRERIHQRFAQNVEAEVHRAGGGRRNQALADLVDIGVDVGAGEEQAFLTHFIVERRRTFQEQLFVRVDAVGRGVRGKRRRRGGARGENEQQGNGREAG